MVEEFARGAMPIGSYYRIGSEILTRYGKHFLVLILLIVLPTSVMGQDWFLSAVRDYSPSLGSIAAIAAIVFPQLLQFAAIIYVVLLAAHELQRKVVTAGSLTALVRDNYLPVLGGSIVYLLFVIVGLVLLVIPGLIIGLLFCFYLEFMLIEHEGIFAAFTKSLDLVRKYFWRTVLVNLAFMLPLAMGIVLPDILDFDPLQNTVNSFVFSAYNLIITLPHIVFFFNLIAMQKADRAALNLVAAEIQAGAATAAETQSTD
ncbi:MAG: hypothetical protein WBQ23_08525 [Bacteroidota bacterium]